MTVWARVAMMAGRSLAKQAPALLAEFQQGRQEPRTPPDQVFMYAATRSRPLACVCAAAAVIMEWR